MPNFDYKCTACKEIFTKTLKKTRSSYPCPRCGRISKKSWFGYSIGLVFKGSGFYKTDYKGK